ncbi:cytoskeleton protein RodZ [Thorsellia anophelis]|uniref:Cytoskeleton protein RodZ n=1 Tax=Thorsellia anophelis DSM 18579 TaxID=1123402 RepID=A0A1H9Y3Y0_9GAMM|nr:cytoskeleton protein RodZ [Thorsellia anophelis]SES63467.1 cytoskeleton protein RodZ [Thorsellia anophelis DSM 18579]
MKTINNETQTPAESQSQTNNEHIQQATIGEIFRSEREKLELTIDTVAKRLHLKKSVIIELENNELPDVASTFVRGYIRSYAKLLGLPESQLLSMVNTEKPLEVASPTPLQSYSIEKKKRRKDIWFKVISGLVVFSIIGVTGAYLHNYQQEKSQSIVPLDTINDSTTINNNIPLSVNSNTPNVSSGANGPLAIPNTNNTQSAPLGIESTLQAPSQPNVLISTEQSENAPTLTIQEAVNDTLAQKNNIVQNEDSESTNIVSSGIIMNFSADCWVELVDASGKILFSGLKKNGDELKFTEGAPFKLKLGVPSAVSINFDGDPIDITGFIKKGQVAKFTVPLTE